MNKKLPFFIKLTLLFNIIIHSQSINIDNVDEFNFKNFGVLRENSGNIFYSFHTSNTIQKEMTSIGYFSLYNSDLSIKKTENFSLNKKTNLFLETRNNEKNVLLAFYNTENEIATFKIYSATGELINTKELTLKSNVFSPIFYKPFETIGDFCLIYPSKNNGFLITEVAIKKRQGYNIHFIGEDNLKNWTYKSPEDHNNRKTVCPIFTNEEIVILMEKEWGSVYDKQPTFTAIILDVKNGKEIFRVSHEFESIPNYYTKATVNKNGDILLFGETYKIGNNYPDNDYNTGYFIEKYSKTGNLISKNDFNFENTIFKSKLGINADEKQKLFGTIFFHEFIFDNGNYYLIGEKGIRTKQGFTIANAMLSATVGGAIGGLISNNWQTKYTLEDIIILEIDENLFLNNVNKLTKDKNFTGLNTMVVRPFFNFKEMERENKLDYLFNTNGNLNQQSIFYLDRKITNQKADFRIRKSVKNETGYNTNEFSKVELKDNEDFFNIIGIDSDKLLLLKFNSANKSINISTLFSEIKN